MHSLGTFVNYLRLPLRVAPLLLIASFTLLFWMAMSAGLFGLPLMIVVVSWFFKYSFVLLDSVIDGRTEPPVLSTETANPVEQRLFGMLLVVIGAYSLAAVVESRFGEWPARTLLGAMLAMLPAMAAVMSISGRFVSALNPRAVIGTIARIPRAYAMLVMAIALLWLTPVWVLQSFDQINVPTEGKSFLPGQLASALGLHGALAGMLGIALFLYLWLAMMSCIGGIMYEHRLELDIDAAHAPERVAARADLTMERDRDREFDRIFAELRGGALANAGASVRAFIERAQQPIAEFRWLYQRAARLPVQRLAEYLAQLGLPRLLQARLTGEALDIARERLKANPNFRPQHASELLRLAALAGDAGDRATARALLHDHERHFPGDPATPLLLKLASELARA